MIGIKNYGFSATPLFIRENKKILNHLIQDFFAAYFFLKNAGMTREESF